MQIGFIGLGIMGKPMAKNLIKAGYKLTVFDNKNESMDDLVALGANKASNGKQVGETSDVIITMLPNSPHVKEAVLGEDGVIEGVKEGAVLIDMSSIAPLTSKEISEELIKKGVEMLDAPVSGGEPKAIDGTIAVMVGGKKEVFDENYEVMKAMAGSVVHVGNIGAGNTAKLCNQIIVAINIAAVSEAFVLAQKAEVDPELIYQAIRGGLAGSTVMDAKVPMILDHNYEPGFRIDLHIKDMLNVLETSQDVGVSLPLSSAVMEIMKAVKVDGFGEKDHSSIVKFYEKISNTTVNRGIGKLDQ